MTAAAQIPAEVREDLLAAIRLARSAPTSPLLDLLYTRWFARFAPAAPDGAREPSLVARLRAAHAATARFERGWSARAVGRSGTVLAERAAERRSVAPPDYANLTRPAAPVRAGDRLAVTARRDRADPREGWWMTDGAAGPAPADGVVRVYWNCPVEAVAPLVGGITAALEGRGGRYGLKCPLTRELFDRVDCVVLYLGVEEWRAASGDLREVHASLAARLREPVPPLTLRLGRGASVAEDPGDGGSFGQSRVRAVADGLAAAAARGLDEDPEVLGVVLDRLRSHGISPEWPHLRAGSPPGLIVPW